MMMMRRAVVRSVSLLSVAGKQLPRPTSIGTHYSRASSCMGQYKIFSRDFVTKKSPTEVATTKSAAMLKLVDEELGVLKSTLDEVGDNSMPSQVADRFLKDHNFQLEVVKGESVKLTRTVGDKKVVVTFPIQAAEEHEAYPEEEMQDEEAEEGEKAEKPAETEGEGEGEGEGEQGIPSREHPFAVEITTKEKKLSFSCYADSDGSFLVSTLSGMDATKIPVNIGDWSEELQRELIGWLGQFGVTESLAYFIHQYLDKTTQQHNIKILEEFREFVGGK